MIVPILLKGGPLDGQKHSVEEPVAGAELRVQLAPDLGNVEGEPHALVSWDGKVYHRHKDGVYRTIGQGVAVYVVGPHDTAAHLRTDRSGGEPWADEEDGKWHGEDHGMTCLWG